MSMLAEAGARLMPPPVRPEDMSDTEWFGEDGTMDAEDEIREDETDEEEDE